MGGLNCKIKMKIKVEMNILLKKCPGDTLNSNKTGSYILLINKKLKNSLKTIYWSNDGNIF